MEWKTIAIPKQTFENIKKVIPFTGHPSVSEYVRDKVNDRLTFDLMKYEEFQDHLERIKKEREEMME